jgi:hypothetical protein
MPRIHPYMLLAACVLVCAPALRAQCLPAVCSLSISVQSDASGLALGGSGSSAATMSFGSMQAFGGSVPSGVTKAVGTSNWTISTPFDVKVGCTNLLTLLPCTIITSPTYNLTAQLQSSDTTNTWKIASLTLSSTTPVTLTSGGTYSVVTAFTFALTIPFTEASGTISNTVNFVAVAN